MKYTTLNHGLNNPRKVDGWRSGKVVMDSSSSTWLPCFNPTMCVDEMSSIEQIGSKCKVTLIYCYTMDRAGVTMWWDKNMDSFHTSWKALSNIWIIRYVNMKKKLSYTTTSLRPHQHNIIQIHNNVLWECQYFVEYFQFHITLLWICMMLRTYLCKPPFFFAQLKKGKRYPPQTKKL